MSGRQKHKGKKRPRSWHRRYNGPDRSFRRAMQNLEPERTANESKIMNQAIELAREGVEHFRAQDIIEMACDGHAGKKIAIRNALSKLILKGHVSGSVPPEVRDEVQSTFSHHYAQSILHSEPEAISSRQAWDWVELHLTRKPPKGTT